MAHDEGNAVDEFTARLSAIVKRVQQEPGKPSYSQLAKSTGLGRATVDRILNARRGYKMGDLRKICQALGINLADVVQEAESSI